MTPEDRGAFAQALTKVGTAYGHSDRNPLEVELIALYFDLLGPYPLAVVRHALHRHTMDPDRGRFFPKVADIVHQIEGDQPQPDWILAIARRNSTPLGAIARFLIGSFDLEHSSDPHYLRRRAEEVAAQWPVLRNRALAGEYTDHELRVFAKYGIDPLGPPELGLPKPVSRELPERAKAAVEGPDYQRLIAPPDEYEDETGAERGADASRAAREQLNALMADIPDGQEDERAYRALRKNL